MTVDPEASAPGLRPSQSFQRIKGSTERVASGVWATIDFGVPILHVPTEAIWENLFKSDVPAGCLDVQSP